MLSTKNEITVTAVRLLNNGKTIEEVHSWLKLMVPEVVADEIVLNIC